MRFFELLNMDRKTMRNTPATRELPAPGVLNASAEPLASLIESAHEEEAACWVASPPGEYAPRLDTAMRTLVAGAGEVVWLSLEPISGGEAYLYPAEAALQLEAAYQQQLAPRSAEHPPTMLMAARVELGSRFFNATVHLNMMPGEGQSIMFQTTPSGGHRSVRRWAFPSAGELSTEPAAATRSVELPVAPTSAGEWAFVPDVSTRAAGAEQADPPSPRAIRVEATAEDVVFSMPWALRKTAPTAAPAAAPLS